MKLLNDLKSTSEAPVIRRNSAVYRQTLLVVLLAALLLPAVAFADAMQVPAAPLVIPPYASVAAPFVSTDPSQAEPIGIGPAASGGDTLSLQIGLPPFSGPVDVYFGYYAPAIDPNNIYVLTSNNTFMPISVLDPLHEGATPWLSNISGGINQSVLGNISISSLPPGTYTAYLLAAPAGRSDSFYLWSTFFAIPSSSADDITAPTTPEGLSAVALSSTEIKMSWHSSADNVGVAGYNLYRDGTFLASVTGTTGWDTNLSPSSTHCYEVSAYDTAGNESALSGQACTTTPTGPDPCAGHPACFPIAITFSGAVTGTIQGTASLENDWYGYSCTGDLVNRAILGLTSADATSFSAHIVVTDSYGAIPSAGTYNSGDYCGDGLVNIDGKKWEWSGGPVAGTYTLVFDVVNIKVVDLQTSVYVAHGTLDATAVPMCVAPGGEEFVCDANVASLVGNVNVHVEF